MATIEQSVTNSNSCTTPSACWDQVFPKRLDFAPRRAGRRSDVAARWSDIVVKVPRILQYMSNFFEEEVWAHHILPSSRGEESSCPDYRQWHASIRLGFTRFWWFVGAGNFGWRKGSGRVLLIRITPSHTLPRFKAEQQPYVVHGK